MDHLANDGFGVCFFATYVWMAKTKWLAGKQHGWMGHEIKSNGGNGWMDEKEMSKCIIFCKELPTYLRSCNLSSDAWVGELVLCVP